jgi:hypothetical protein
MSLHYDLVVNCDLREDASASCIELISWLTDENSEPESRPKFDCLDSSEKERENVWIHPFLAPELDDETISVFQKRYRYTAPANKGGRDVYQDTFQYSARNLLDDEFYDCHLSFLDWMARITENGFIGYYKEEFDTNPTLMYVKAAS